jgi:hypothetical protein
MDKRVRYDLAELGFKKVRHSAGVVWKGISTVPEEDTYQPSSKSHIY